MNEARPPDQWKHKAGPLKAKHQEFIPMTLAYATSMDESAEPQDNRKHKASNLESIGKDFMPVPNHLSTQQMNHKKRIPLM